jgi:hypothetical protein
MAESIVSSESLLPPASMSVQLGVPKWAGRKDMHKIRWRVWLTTAIRTADVRGKEWLIMLLMIATCTLIGKFFLYPGTDDG